MTGSVRMPSASAHDLGRHGGREEQRLALRRQRPDDPPDVVDEAHVEHPVGLVEDEDLEPVEADVALADQVEQAAGRGDEDVDAARQRLDLRALADAAEDHGVAQLQVAAVGREARLDLGGELAGRGQHQGAAGPGPGAARLAGQALQDRQREGGGLAGAGLGAAEQVAALRADGGSPAPGSGSAWCSPRRARRAEGARSARARQRMSPGSRFRNGRAPARRPARSVQAIPRAAEAASLVMVSGCSGRLGTAEACFARSRGSGRCYALVP